MRIIQQTSKLLQFRERKFKEWFGLVFIAGTFTGIPVGLLVVPSSESQYIRVNCDVISSIRSEPCTLAHQKSFTAMVKSEPVKKVSVEITQNQDGTTFRLILSTAKEEHHFYYPSIKELEADSEKVEKMLTSGRILGTQLEPLTIVRDTRLTSLIFGIGLGLLALLFAIVFTWVMLSIPTHMSLKFDKANNSIVSSSYQFFRRIHHNEILLSQVQKLNWTSQTSISRDESGEEVKTETFNVKLVLRSGEVIPLIPPLWSNYWRFEESEAFAITISHFLNVEVPELFDVTILTSFKERNTYSAYLQEQAQLKKQRSEIRDDG